MAIDYKAWKRHFAKEPRSTEMVQVPRDVFDFMLETFEAFGASDGGDAGTIVACQFLVTKLAKEIQKQHDAPSTR